MARFNAPPDKGIQELENITSDYWTNNKIFERSVNERSKDNLYVFYDGPPFISGLPHYGHLLGSIAKDIIPRYQTMRGKRVERVWGWDAHGLTVENKVQKKLGIERRRQIEEFGLEKFIQECYKYTSETSEEWKWYINKIGRWVDMEHAYKTIDQSYMESVIWAFKEMYDKGLIYEGVYTSLYCTTCGTPVSNFEIAMDNTYKDYVDPAITVKFKVTSNGKFKDSYILAWTTTPWTIPSNRALVIKEDELYVEIECDAEHYILAKPRLEATLGERNYKVLNEFHGNALIGLEYFPIFTFYKSVEGEYKVYAYEGMVTMDDGTGVVHSAPGFGEIDTQMGRHYNLSVMMTIDDEGKFLPGNNGKNPYEGIYYAKANEIIKSDLLQMGVLFDATDINHRVPYHDRCNTVLIQRAQNSWFVNIQKLKDRLLETNQNINWVPSHLKEGRFAIGIRQAPDWCISRNRFWATPMPVWRADDGEKIVVGSISELEKLSGQKVKDLHRPYIDEIVINKNGKTFKRISEVLDSWFEAGSMPYAQIHYPMENSDIFETNFPGDYIVEYIAQTRAWFFFMHVLSNALFEKNSFKNVISTGVMAGSDGRKMSKTYGNYTDPKDILTKVGGDALRLYLMSSPLMVGENANFDDEELRSNLKNVLNPLWNSLKFFLMYASQSNWDPSKLIKSDNKLDVWILARLNFFVKVFSENIENYVIPDAVVALKDFVDDLSRWYVRRSRNRVSQGDLAAISTLYTVLFTFCKAAAPAIPFVTEQMYLCLRDSQSDPDSVHLCSYPEYDNGYESTYDDIVTDMNLVRKLVTLGHAARTQAAIAVRQPLATLYVELSTTVSKLENSYEEILKDELNVKSIEYVESIKEGAHLVEATDKDFKVSLDISIDETLEIEGNKRAIERTIQGMRKDLGLTISNVIRVYYPESYQKTISLYENEIKNKVNAGAFVLHDKPDFKIELI